MMVHRMEGLLVRFAAKFRDPFRSAAENSTRSCEDLIRTATEVECACRQRNETTVRRINEMTADLKQVMRDDDL